MAYIRKVTRKQGTRYVVQWRRAGRSGGEPGLTFTDERMAVAYKGVLEAQGEEVALQWVEKQIENPLPDPEGVKTLDDWMAHYIDHRTGITPGTRDGYHREYKRTWADLEFEPGRRFGSLPLEMVTRDHVARAIIQLAETPRESTGKPLSPKSIANAHGLLSAAMDEAAETGRITMNPCRGIRLPDGESDADAPEEHVYLEPAEFQLLLAELPEYWHPLVLTLYGTGMRWGEVTALQIRHVNLDTAMLRVVQAWKKGPRGGAVLGAPKKKSRRDIQISAQLVEVLRPLVARKGPDDLLFTAAGHANRIWHHMWYRKTWMPAVWRAQRCEQHWTLPNPCGCVYQKPKRCTVKEHTRNAIPQGCGCPGTLLKTPRIHDLRHSHASLLLARGLPIAVVSKRLGHKSIKITVDTYGHLMSESQERAAAIMDEALTSVVSASLAG